MKIIENVKKGSKKVYKWGKDHPEVIGLSSILAITGIATFVYYKQKSSDKQKIMLAIDEYGIQQYLRGQYAGRGAAKNAFINYLVGLGKTYQEAVDIIDKLEYIHYDGNMKI